MSDDRPSADPTIIRSEERLHVGTRLVPIGRAVLRRTVVVEQRTITVEVRHEEAHFEVLPFDGQDPDEADHGGAHLALPELVLHQEEVVLTRRIVPVERVRLQITPVTEQRRITEDVRQERITFDDGSGSTAPGTEGTAAVR